MLHQSVIDAFPGLTRPLEGCVLWPYLDCIGLVTVGYGCLIDPEQMASLLDWQGKPAPGDIAQQWHALKASQRLAKLHYKYAEPVTTLRLSQAGADQLLDSRALLFAAYLEQHHFPDWQDWPADAQLAAMAMAWACGDDFPTAFKTFKMFALKRQWALAANCAHIRTDGNPGIIPRNAQVQLCLANAAAIDDPTYGMPTPALYWPGGVAEAPTLSSDPKDLPLSVLAAQALERFKIEDCGITGHRHVCLAA